MPIPESEGYGPIHHIIGDEPILTRIREGHEMYPSHGLRVVTSTHVPEGRNPTFHEPDDEICDGDTEEGTRQHIRRPMDEQIQPG